MIHSCVTWPIHMYDMTHVFFDLLTCVTWLMCNLIYSLVCHALCECTVGPEWNQSYTRDMTHLHVWHDSFTCVSWFLHMCDVTHPYMSRDSFVCMAWLIHTCVTWLLHVWHDSFICETWLSCVTQTCILQTYSNVWHNSSIHVTWLLRMHDMTRPYVRLDTPA